MKKRKILIVVESLGCGGAEKSLVSLLPLIDYKKFEVDLLIYNRNRGLFEQLVDERVHILPNENFQNFCSKPIVKQVLSFNISYIFARLRWKAAIIFNKKMKYPKHSSEVYWKSCSKVISPITNHYDVAIAWGQGHSTHYVAEKVNADKKYAWINANYVLGNHDKAFDMPFYRVMNRIIVVSEQLLPITQKVFPEFAANMKVIYDVINADLIFAMSQEYNPFENDKKLHIVTVGRLAPQKGYNLALQACKIMKEKGIRFIWYALGEGSMRDELEQYIKEHHLEDNFVLLGVKDNPYVYTGHADIYVQTSVFEGYCLTLAEARILNKPIVTTDFDVVHDQIEHGYNGLIAQMNPTSIADAIIRLATDDDLRNRLSENLKKEKKGNIEEAEKFNQLLSE